MTSALWLQNPEWLAAVATAIALVALFLGLAILRGRDRTERLLGDRRALPLRHLFSDAWPLAALVMIGVALLGPRLAEREVRISTRGVDVVLLMDVSQSMQAADTPPSRAVRAQAAAKQLLAELGPGDRAALAAFAGRGVLLTPLTPDTDALTRMLPALQMRLVRPGGTDLDAGVAAAHEAFEPGSRRPAVIVVLSDGEITVSSGTDSGLRAALQSGTRIVALALGSSEGARVPDQGAPLRDAEGAIVVSRRHDAALERIARASDGAFQVANEWGTFDLPAVLDAVRRELAGAAGDWVVRREVAASILPFACAAALFLLLDAIPLQALARRARRTERRRLTHASTRGGALRAGLCTLPLLLLGAEHGPAAVTFDAEARAALLRGLAHAELGDWSAAWEGLHEAVALAEDPSLASLAWYDLGVLYLEIGPLFKARDAFYEALALRPGDDEATFNLEWTLLAIERDASPHPPADSMKEPSATRDAEDESEGSRQGPAGLEHESPAARSDRNALDAGESTSPEQSTLPRSPLAGAGDRTQLEPLDPAELQRWLERVEDDPLGAMRAQARSDGSRRAKNGPSW